MPNNCLPVLYKRIIQVENKNVGLKVGGHKHTIAPPPNQKRGGGGTCLPCPPPPASYASASSSYLIYGVNPGLTHFDICKLYPLKTATNPPKNIIQKTNKKPKNKTTTKTTKPPYI